MAVKGRPKADLLALDNSINNKCNQTGPVVILFYSPLKSGAFFRPNWHPPRISEFEVSIAQLQKNFFYFFVRLVFNAFPIAPGLFE